MVSLRAMWLCVLAAVFGVVCVRASVAGIDVEVPPALSAKSTLSPEGEVETFRFHATRGTSLTFVAAAKKGARLGFTAQLFDEGGGEVAIPAANSKLSAKKLTVKKLLLETTGTYRLQLSATGTGEYALKLQGKPGTKFVEGRTLPQAGTESFEFAAPPGSRVTLLAKAARKSVATPRFGTLTGDGVSDDLSGQGKVKSNSHKVVLSDVAGTGDFSVDVDNPGGAGDATVSIVVQAPKVKTWKLDARGSARGYPFGGETVFVRPVGAAGGTVTVGDSGSDIMGATVTFPPGALPGNTNVTVASAPPLTPAAADQSAGPAVFLGPSGLTFAQPVDIKLPYDPAQIPVGQTPQDLRVQVVEENGLSAILTPIAVDDQAHTITVQASGFSTCVAVSRVGQQPLGVRPGGDEFWLLTLDGEIETDQSGDSRRRDYSIGIGEVSFQALGEFQISTEERSVSFDNPTSQDGNHLDGSASVQSQPNDETLSWSYGSDGQTVVIDANDGQVTISTSRDGNYLLARSDHAGEPRAETNVLVRKNKTSLSGAVLAGKYHLLFWSVGADNRGPDQGVRPQTSRLFGSITFDNSGGLRVAGTQRDSDLNSSGGPTSRAETFSADGTYTIEAAGTVIVTIPPQGQDDTGAVFRLYPGPGATVMLGTDRDAPSDPYLQCLVLVRQGSGLGNSTVTGEYAGVEFDQEPNPYNVPTSGPDIVVADFQIADAYLGMTFSGTGTLGLVQTRVQVRRDTEVADGVAIQSDSDPLMQIGSKIDKTGKFTVTVPGETNLPVGAFTADGMFGCGVSDPVKGDAGNGLLFFVKLPPAK